VLILIINEVRSLTEELKTGPGKVEGKKINRPISLGKRKFSKEISVEKLLSLFSGKNEACRKIFCPPPF